MRLKQSIWYPHGEKLGKKIEHFVNNTAIERVDTFCYLGVVFKYNNTFQAAIKNNVDKAKKVLFKLEVLFSKIDFGIDTKLHLFDAVIKPILLYGCEVWGYESMELIEIFHRYFLRRVLRVRKKCSESYGIWGVGGKRIEVNSLEKNGIFLEKTYQRRKQPRRFDISDDKY